MMVLDILKWEAEHRILMYRGKSGEEGHGTSVNTDVDVLSNFLLLCDSPQDSVNCSSNKMSRCPNGREWEEKCYWRDPAGLLFNLSAIGRGGSLKTVGIQIDTKMSWSFKEMGFSGGEEAEDLDMVFGDAAIAAL